MFNIKNATNFELKAIDSDKCIKIDYPNNFKSNLKGDEKYYNNEASCTFKLDSNKLEGLFEIDDSFIVDCKTEFMFNGVEYNLMVNNIPGKYACKCSELVGEYCKNIIYKLAKEGHEFVNGEVIDFQEYLV